MAIALLIAGSLLLTSCETQTSDSDDTLNPQATITRAGDNALTLPPGMNEDGTSPRQKLEGMKGLKGVNVDQLFSENIRDTDKRFDRLETVVKDFRQEYESIKPEIIRLVAIEKDMQKLIDLLSSDVGLPADSPGFATLDNDPLPMEPVALAQTGETTPPPPAAVLPQPAVVPEQPVVTPAPVTPPPAAQAAVPAPPQETAVTDFRFGTHSDYTRLVLDVTTSSSYNLDLDPSGEILKVVLPSTAWNTAMTKNYPSHSILQSYSVQKDPQNGDTLLYISFKKPVKVINQGTLKNDSAPKFRIFVDVR